MLPLVEGPDTLPRRIRWRDRGLTAGAWLAVALLVERRLPHAGGTPEPATRAFAADLATAWWVAAGVVGFLLLWGALERRVRSRVPARPGDPVQARGVRQEAILLGTDAATLRAWRRAPVLRVVVAPDGRILRPAEEEPPESAEAAG